ncbi:hypothetical protein HRbin20_00602 [bacterium HR20]|jgi:hypothetical protein|nr:hypothetical protein HRbin20_00602 [bacterium HR20]GIV49488.1 MAG: hypothetical protein KatS3mg038_0009 [Candidatus Kapabacteria bacterium]GIV56705.1 MAG: hypothetical protein KatS3mg040_1473 [Candidatus Kapabacteria bacterium]
MSSAAVQWIVRCYAAILVVAGVASYALGTSHAPIALVGGVGGGALLVVLSGLFRRRVFWSRPALVTAVGIFTLSFIWRSAESFMRGQQRTGLLLAALAAVSLPVFVVLLRAWNR